MQELSNGYVRITLDYTMPENMMIFFTDYPKQTFNVYRGTTKGQQGTCILDMEKSMLEQCDPILTGFCDGDSHNFDLRPQNWEDVLAFIR